MPDSALRNASAMVRLGEGAAAPAPGRQQLLRKRVAVAPASSPAAALRMRGSAPPPPGRAGWSPGAHGSRVRVPPRPRAAWDSRKTGHCREAGVCLFLKGLSFYRLVVWVLGFFEMGGGWLGRRDSGDAHLWPWG